MMTFSFYVGIMELGYNLLLSAFIALLLSYLIAKLMPLAVSGGEEVPDSGVDNGGKRTAPAPIAQEEGNLEKKLKVKGSKSKKKRMKKISAETVLVSEFMARSEPPTLGGLSEAGASVDNSEKLGSFLEKEFVLSGERVEFSGVQKEDAYFGPLKSEDRLIGDDSLKLVDSDERIDRRECDADVIRLGSDMIEPRKDEKTDALDVRNEVSKENVNEGGAMELSDEDEWEGIEKNELEKDFARATNYVEAVKKEGRLNEISSEVIVQFDDLQKVAMEGPCQDHPKISAARVKWNSWQKSESLNSEEAMEQYITLLSDKVPGWDSQPSVESELVSEKDDTFRTTYTAPDIPLLLPLACTNESKPAEKSFTGSRYLDGGSSSVNEDGE